MVLLWLFFDSPSLLWIEFQWENESVSSGFSKWDFFSFSSLFLVIFEPYIDSMSPWITSNDTLSYAHYDSDIKSCFKWTIYHENEWFMIIYSISCLLVIWIIDMNEYMDSTSVFIWYRWKNNQIQMALNGLFQASFCLMTIQFMKHVIYNRE